ncbi:PH domain-containing protein [Kitasatospora purpeofusca]|uniref:PH domain-containing protein n=1 Tax=Kitasatospora purpeofusca TaxID=67352 RepID=UPI0035E10DAF
MALFGNAHRVDNSEAQKEFARLFGQGEQVHAAYQLVRDTFLFTDRRLILVDKQGITGKKTEYHSIPYRSITHFAVETCADALFGSSLGRCRPSARRAALSSR